MLRKVPFLDLRVSDEAERLELLAAVDAVFRHGRLVMGPEVQEFEQQVAARCDRRFAVGVNSGSDALMLGLKALEIGPGAEVITSSLSWIATANAIAMTGATPVFADIQDDLNLNPASVARLITSRTKALMPVHYTGKVCQMDALMELAAAHGLHVVEDGSQSFGARFRDRQAGAFGVLACISLNPMKVFAACGEAGVVLTDSEKLVERLVALRYNGTVNREVCIEPSVNGRLDTLQAAILLQRIKRVDGIIQKRREIAGWYQELLHGLVTLPVEQPGEFDVFYTYTIRSLRRDDLKAFLESRGIETKVQHPILMPEQPAYKKNARGEWENAQRLVHQILCIPGHEKLSRLDVEYVADNIREFHRGGSSCPK